MLTNTAPADVSPITECLLMMYRDERAWTRAQLYHGAELFYNTFKRKDDRIMPCLRWSREWEAPLEVGPHALDFKFAPRITKERPISDLCWRFCTTTTNRETGQQIQTWGDAWRTPMSPPVQVLKLGGIVGDDVRTYRELFNRLCSFSRYYKDLRTNLLAALRATALVTDGRPAGFDGPWNSLLGPECDGPQPWANFPRKSWIDADPKGLGQRVEMPQKQRSDTDSSWQ